MHKISPLVRKAVRQKQEELLKRKGVVAIMSGKQHKGGKKTNNDAVVVLVEKKLPLAQIASEDLIPSTVEVNGVQVHTDVIEVGEIKALHTRRHRPLVPGVSVGHYAITAGTLGLVVKKDDELHILSNNHVLANGNNAKIGDPILQPGLYDGGRHNDVVAELSHYVPINFKGTNYVDAALAKIVNSNNETPNEDPTPEPPKEDDRPFPPPKDNSEDDDLISKVFKFFERLLKKIFGFLFKSKTKVQTVNSFNADVYVNNPYNIPTPITKELADIDVGDTVQKSGRTTGYTVGEVLGIDATVNVSYENGVALFVDQIICGPMSAGGDSGSVVYDMKGNAVGLLFAGSDKVTIVNPIKTVWKELGIDEIA